MSQQNIYPIDSDENEQIQSKTILLYLIDKIDIPISHGQIAQFASEENFMNHYTVSKYLNEMVISKLLDKTKDGNTTRYTISDAGIETLGVFVKNMDINIKNRIAKYASENRKNVKQDYELIANFFYDHKNKEYLVKCGIYDDEMMILELNLSVVSKDQALSICNNWKGNIDILYGQVIDILLSNNKDEDN